MQKKHSKKYAHCLTLQKNTVKENSRKMLAVCIFLQNYDCSEHKVSRPFRIRKLIIMRTIFSGIDGNFLASLVKKIILAWNSSIEIKKLFCPKLASKKMCLSSFDKNSQLNGSVFFFILKRCFFENNERCLFFLSIQNFVFEKSKKKGISLLICNLTENKPCNKIFQKLIRILPNFVRKQ